MTRVAALLIVPLIGILTMLFAVVVVLGPTSSSAASPSSVCSTFAKNASGSGRLDQEQRRSAGAIIAVGRALQVPVRGWVVAVATALQESGLRPLPYGDRDSIGLFQQRSGWGSYAERIDPFAATRMFFTGGSGGQPGLLDIAGWERLPLTEAAQAVQASAFPDAYARWEAEADAIVREISGAVATGCASSGKWTSPIRTGDFVLTARFGECGGHWENCHTGLDFAASADTPAHAACAGVVTFAGLDGPYGNAVRVLHPDGIATWYAHLDRILVSPGQRVTAGEVVGLVGQTGNADGFHLHFEVRRHASQTQSGTPIDPLPWLREHGAMK